MKIVFISISVLIGITFIKAQDLSFKKVVDRNLTVTFPSSIDSVEVEKTKIYNSTSGIVQFSFSKHTSTVIDKS